MWNSFVDVVGGGGGELVVGSMAVGRVLVVSVVEVMVSAWMLALVLLQCVEFV